jgi:hypothetical protein
MELTTQIPSQRQLTESSTTLADSKRIDGRCPKHLTCQDVAEAYDDMEHGFAPDVGRHDLRKDAVMVNQRWPAKRGRRWPAVRWRGSDGVSAGGGLLDSEGVDADRAMAAGSARTVAYRTTTQSARGVACWWRRPE